MKTYEELSGARGREIFYRAERYKAPDLFRREMPTLALATEPYILHDVSMTGLGAMASRGSNNVHGPGQRLHVHLGLRDVPLFEAEGEVVRIERSAAGSRIGVRLLDGCIDIGRLAARYQAVLAKAELDDWDDARCVSPEYRQLCADVLHLLRSHRAGLDRFEATAPDATTAADLLAACEERIIPRWRELWARGNELVAPLAGDRHTWQATKRYTETVVTPDFMLGAFARRCYEKPLGYPGDYEIMNMAYDRRREGARLSDQLAHLVGLDVGECVANRMIMMRQAIAETVVEGSRNTVRVTSLGSGPAREVVDYLAAPAFPHPVHFTLIDQDHAALSQAYGRCLPSVMRHRGRAAVTCLHSSFTEMLKAGEAFERLPEQDLIYSVGLIDYLAARRAKSLVEALYDRLAPGGRLVVGNMKAGSGSTLWPVEFITDWTLNYRNCEAMLALASHLPGAMLETRDDGTDRVCLLVARKPARG